MKVPEKEVREIWKEIGEVVSETGKKLIDISSKHSVDPDAIITAGAYRLLEVVKIAKKVEEALADTETTDELDKMIDDALAKVMKGGKEE